MQAQESYKPYSLGLDIGTNSLGWAVLAVDPDNLDRPTEILGMGSRIFSDGRAIDKAHMGESLGETLQSDRRKKINTMRAHQRDRARRGRLLRMLSDGLGLVRTNGCGRGLRVDWVDPFKATASNRDAWLRRESVFAARAACATHPLDSTNKYDRARLARSLYSLLVNRGTLLTDDGEIEEPEPEAPPKKRKGKAKEVKATIPKGDDPASLRAECTRREEIVAAAFGIGGLGIWLSAQFERRHPFAPIRARRMDSDRRKDHWKNLDDETIARIGSQALPGRSSRKMVEEEFARIRETQSVAFESAGIGAGEWDKLRALIFERAPYNAVRWPCPYVPADERTPRFDPSAQQYLAWEKAWNLRAFDGQANEIDLDVTSGPGSPSLRRRFYATLLTQPRLTWKQASAALGLPESTSFNRVNASGKETHWSGHPFPELGRWISERDRGTRDDGRERVEWPELRDRVLNLFSAPIRGEDRDFATIPSAIAVEIRDLLVAPPRGSIPYGRSMLQGMLPLLETMRPHAARDAALARINEERELDTYALDEYRAGRLPYYGAAFLGMLPRLPSRRKGPYSKGNGPTRVICDVEAKYGRVPNPSVHIALNQTRRVVNEIARKYGRPSRIVIETTRQLHLSDRGRMTLLKRIAENEKRNREAEAAVRRVLGNTSAEGEENRRAVRRYKLWKELTLCGEREARLCPYCGNHEVTMSDAINGHGVDIDHIYPRSLGGGDEMGNCILCCKPCNAEKTNTKTPLDAFGNDAERWERISDATRYLPARKRRMILNPENERSKFLAGQLESTSWASKMLLQWLRPLCLVETNVLASRGELTGTLRKRWDLEDLKKDESGMRIDDNRHHAIDALVTAALSRSLLQKAARGNDLAVKNFDLWDGFKADVERAHKRIVTSHKVERPRILFTADGRRAASVPGAMHYETIYARSGVREQKASALLPPPLTRGRLPLNGPDAAAVLMKAHDLLGRLVESPVAGKSTYDSSQVARLCDTFSLWFGAENPSMAYFRERIDGQSEIWLRCNGRNGPKLNARPPSETGEICTTPWNCEHGTLSGVFRTAFDFLCARNGVAKIAIRPTRGPDESGSEYDSEFYGPPDGRRETIYGLWRSAENLCAVVENIMPLRVRLFQLLRVIADPEELHAFAVTKPEMRIYKNDAIRIDRRVCLIKTMRIDQGRFRIGLEDINTREDVGSEPALQTLLKRHERVELGVTGLLGGFRLKMRLDG
ncbi:MAG: hypothetical protein HKL92_07890 [Candidatus Eremiobacteraeota bacterium]|nr:hypothetical protein [Candidatus Eremiobacteraeota bacterium]